jgi:hypothetical protein
MLSWYYKAGLAGLAVVAATALAVAQMPAPQGMHAPGVMGGMVPGQQGGAMGGHHMMMAGQASMGGQPSMSGQDAFGAIQEIVQKLEADPATDWSKVDIAALREHLIDMNEVTLRASAAEQALDNGVEITVTGEGRTREAIKRMVPAHARELAANGWQARTEELPNGVRLTVVTSDPKQAMKLKALGFMGIMVQGGHHQPHHLAIAKGGQVGEHVH